MKFTWYQKIAILVVVGMTTLTARGASAQLFNQMNNAAACIGYGAGTTDDYFQHLASGIYRTVDSAGAKYLTCPLAPPYTPADPPAQLLAYINVVRGSTGTIWCYLVAYQYNGTYITQGSDSWSGSGSDTLALAVGVTNQDDYYSLYCQLPEGSQIRSYEYYFVQ